MGLEHPHLLIINVNHVTNTAQHPLMGGTYSIDYTYDRLNRLAMAQGDWGGQGYDLTMAYNAVGGILTKELNAPDISGFDLPNAESYGLCYAYDSQKPHQLKALHGQGVIRHFEYNDAGSVTAVYTLEGEEPEPFPFCVSATQEPGLEMPEGMGQRIYQERFVWDEEQRLMGVRNQAGIHHYLYDAQGERLMKTSLLGADVAINGEGTAGLSTLDPYLLYVNPYFVQRHYHNWKESSKHYYMGSQRIASELMGAPFDADGLADPPLEDPSGMEKTQSGSSYPNNGAFGALSAWSSFDTLLQRLEISTDPNLWDGLQSLIPYQDYFLESQYHDLQEGCETQTPNPPNPPNLPNQQNPPKTPNPECLCANSPFYAWQIHGIECTEYRLLYWYHPDYLGHNEFITDNSGLPYQYFHYSAFGETLVEDNAHYGQFSSPYRFNAKELDGEPSGASSRTPMKNKTWGEQTGNYYYGARYYNPTWSVWLGVDPLAGAYPHLTPYNFVENNPIRLIDPTGLGPEEPEGEPKTHTIVENDTYFGLATRTYKDDPTVTVENLRLWNPGIDENDLQLGQVINISDPNSLQDSKDSEQKSETGTVNQEASQERELNNDCLTPRNYPTLEEWAAANNRDLVNEAAEGLVYGTATTMIGELVLTGTLSLPSILIGVLLSGLAISFDQLKDYESSLTPDQRRQMSERIRQIQEGNPSKYGE